MHFFLNVRNVCFFFYKECQCTLRSVKNWHWPEILMLIIALDSLTQVLMLIFMPKQMPRVVFL